MEPTVHGAERVIGRTKMLMKDVLSIISNRAAVQLESNDGKCYFLFYSPPDMQMRVAVVSSDGQRLISILRGDFLLPAGVQAITPKLGREARALLRNFLFARAKATARKEASRKLGVKIEVCAGSEVIYTHDGGQITIQEAETLGSISKALTMHLSRIVRLVEANKEMVNCRIKYVIRLFNPGAVQPLKTRFALKHDLLMKQLFPTA